MRLFKRLFKRKKKTEFKRSCWNDLTLTDIMQIKSINTLQVATEDEKNLMVAALVAGIDYQELIQMPLDKAKEYMDNTAFLLEEPKPKKAKRSYIINGRKYRLMKNEMEMLTSQYIDFQAIYRDGFEKKPGELLSIMMVPEGHEYNDGYDKDQVIADMYDMRVEEALGIVDFFTMRFVRLITWTKMYYALMMKWRRLWARKEEKELLRATEIQLNLIMDELSYMFGWIVQGR